MKKKDTRKRNYSTPESKPRRSYNHHEKFHIRGADLWPAPKYGSKSTIRRGYLEN